MREVENRLREKVVLGGDPVMTEGELVCYRDMDHGDRVWFLTGWQNKVGIYPAKDGCYARPHREVGSEKLGKKK